MQLVLHCITIDELLVATAAAAAATDDCQEVSSIAY